MSYEWYEYSVSIKDRTEKIDNMLIFNICSFILLGIFSMAVFFFNIIAFFVIALSYILLFVINKKNKDIYAKNLFSIGTFIFYLSLETFFVFQKIALFEQCFFIMLPIFVIIYEIKVFISIKQKKYSSKKGNFSNVLSTFLMLISGTTIGFRFGKLIGNTLNGSPAFFVVLAMVMALLIICSIMYIQRYAVYSFLKSNYEP